MADSRRGCPFCKERTFGTRQALRAHLRWCEPYQQLKADPDYRPATQVDAFLCGECFEPPTATQEEIDEADGWCSCGSQGHWVKVGVRSVREEDEVECA